MDLIAQRGVVLSRRRVCEALQIRGGNGQTEKPASAPGQYVFFDPGFAIRDMLEVPEIRDLVSCGRLKPSRECAGVATAPGYVRLTCYSRSGGRGVIPPLRTVLFGALVFRILMKESLTPQMLLARGDLDAPMMGVLDALPIGIRLFDLHEADANQANWGLVWQLD